MKKRPTFGVITAECYREHTAEMMSGILAQCTLADCNVIVLSAKNNFQEPVSTHNYHEADLYELAQASEFDGFLYDRNSFAHQGIRKHIDDLLKRTGKPVMLLDASEVPYFENTVTHDPEAFELLVEHMIQVHGYRKIYCLTGQKAFTQSAE
ncbi:MAG: LacI family DNA-binding transcriptional regulator, partial [Ruminococcus sp.]|nr:LacI family DNA-binding transcriptional regulator [Ruminococcus sp.]